MKAITLHQPWASLIVAGEKQYETRGWQPRGLQVGDLLAIHAGKKWDAATQQSWYALQQRYPAACAVVGADLPRGAIVGIVRFMGVKQMTVSFLQAQSPQELAVGNWKPGRYAWQLEVVEKFAVPIPARGAQGIWDWHRTPPAPREVAPATSPAEGVGLATKHQVTTTTLAPYNPGGFYRWSVEHFGATGYHRAEHYARAVHALAVAVYVLRHTPTYTQADKYRLSDILKRLRQPFVENRKAYLDEKHTLENKQETYLKVRARVLGCEMELHRALAAISTEDRVKVDHLIYGYTLNHAIWQRNAA